MRLVPYFNSHTISSLPVPVPVFFLPSVSLHFPSPRISLFALVSLHSLFLSLYTVMNAFTACLHVSMYDCVSVLYRMCNCACVVCMYVVVVV